MRVYCTYQCNAQLPLIRAEGVERLGMAGGLIAIFTRLNGNLSSLKKFTQAAKVYAFNLGRSVSGASDYIYSRKSTQTKSSLDQRHTTVQISS